MPRPYSEFDPAWGQYDVEMAQKYGLRPDPVTGHGPSRVPFGPDEGLYLKTEDHDTFWKAVLTDLLLWGGKIYRNKKNGRVYSFEAGRKVGPEFEELEWTGPLFTTEKLVPKNTRKNAVNKAFKEKQPKE